MYTDKKGEVERHLNKEWYFGHENIITIELSPVQFADAISNMNTFGVPCTIKTLNGKYLEECPDVESKKELFRNEFKEDLEAINDKLQNEITKVETIIREKKTLNKADKESILSCLSKIQQDLRSNFPYMSECFDEQMDKSVSSSKAEVEAYFQNKIISLGLEKLEELKGMTNVLEIEGNENEDR